MSPRTITIEDTQREPSGVVPISYRKKFMHKVLSSTSITFSPLLRSDPRFSSFPYFSNPPFTLGFFPHFTRKSEEPLVVFGILTLEGESLPPSFSTSTYTRDSMFTEILRRVRKGMNKKFQVELIHWSRLLVQFFLFLLVRRDE